MTSKAEYLKKYLSKEDSEHGVGETKKRVRKKKKVPKKQSNLAILDDDIDWRALAPTHTGDSDVEEDDPDEAPVVAEFRDETLPTKWQPMTGVVEEGSLHEDNSDLSPPRRSTVKHDRRKEESPDDDLSPPRRSTVKHDRRKEGSPDDDLSPVRRHRKPEGEDLSPPRQSSRDLLMDKHPSGHTSPSSIRHVTPPTKKHDSLDSRSSKRSRWDRSADLSPPRQPKTETRMASGVKAGLQSAKVLKHENVLARERQEKFYKGLEPDLSGKHAETVYRDKTGQKIDPKLEKVKQREEERRKMEEDTQFMEWGRG